MIISNPNSSSAIPSSSPLATSLSSSSSLPLRLTPVSNGTGDLQQQQQQRQQEEQHHEFHIDESILNNEQHNHLLHHHHHHHQHHHTDISSMMKIRQSGSGEEPFNPVPENNGGWSNFNFNAPMTNSSAIPFINHRNQSCLELNTGQTLPYSQHPAWPLSANSETFSPTHGIEHIPDFNNPFAINQIGENGGESGGGGGGDYPINPVLVSPGPLQPSTFPTSPPFSTSSSDGHDLRHDSIQGRTHSPSFSTAAHILRRDGIRKKNARFDIPAERNLKTIDQLINSTNDESELKELKQQKRLLRNRQAALDSRQRKKQHTERLEEEKKHYSTVINELEDALQDCKAREGEWLREKEIWAVTQQQYYSHIDDFRLQQEEIVRHHTIETGELRRKNAMLMEQLQRFESTEMSNAPSSHGISPEYSEFDQMNLGPWDNLNMGHEFAMENSNQTSVQEQTVKPSQEPEKPAASAFLLMLLLCGAWVASRTNTSSSNILPAIPDDMRAASANVLDNLYKDSGVQLDGINSVTKTSTNPSTKTVLSVIESSGAFSSNLDNLHQHLTTPTSQQLKDQAFSLTPSQYYEMTSVDARYQQVYYDHQQQQQRSNSKMTTVPAQHEDSNVADTYIRSLLRDKVSTQILKDFARMVAQSNLEPPVIWKTESMS